MNKDKVGLWRGVEPCSPAAMFQAWQADVLLVRYTYYQGVVSVIRYKLAELIKKKVWREASSPVAMFKHNCGESNPDLPCPIYYREVVSVGKGSVIILYKLAE